jgi:hypothetical protein
MIIIYRHSLISCSYFASGTGAAGLVGAFLWWEVRGLGVRVGVGLSSVRLIQSMFIQLSDHPADDALHYPTLGKSFRERYDTLAC